MFLRAEKLSLESLYAFCFDEVERVAESPLLHAIRRDVFAFFAPKIGEVRNQTLYVRVAQMLERAFDCDVKKRKTLTGQVLSAKGEVK